MAQHLSNTQYDKYFYLVQNLMNQDSHAFMVVGAMCLIGSYDTTAR